MASFVFLVFTISTNAANLPDFPFVVSPGDAKQAVKPDIATININVLAFDKDSSKALESANMASKSVIDLLKKYDININQLEAGDIQKSTTRQRDSNYKSLEILGYEVSRNITLKLIDLSYYSELMNDLVSINNVSGAQTQFDASNRKEIKLELIQQAGRDAKDNATQMAHALNSKVHSVFSISQGSNFDGLYASFSAPPNPQHRTLEFRRTVADITMFIPESIEISQHINVVFRLK